MNERAGDRAIEKHFYEDAAEYYREALSAQTMDPADRLRLSEKIGRAFFLSGDPDAANPWFDRVLAAYLADPKDAAESVKILFQITRQLSLDCKSEAMLPVLVQAIQIAGASGDTRLCKLANLRMAGCLHELGRDEEAAEILRVAGHVTEGDDASLRSYYLSRCATAAAVGGKAEDAYEAFELAIQLAKNDLDPYRITVVWGAYAAIAQELGDSNRAKACYEQALLVARQYRIAWRIPMLSLGYADLLACMGQHHTAHEYLLEALSYDTRAPDVDVSFVCVGIPIALQVRDELTLAKCTRPKVIELAFQSGRPDATGNVASAFAQLYASQERTRAARSLLGRALEKIHSVRNNLDLMIAIARHGAFADVPRARILLEARSHLPHAAIFHAGLALFNAFVEQRRGHPRKARMYARDAAKRFDAVQWHGRAELARSIILGDHAVRPSPAPNKPFSHMQPALTAREQEVAMFVLKGLTNREIANELAIAPHTVEKHMNSIMGRLGIRSRHQLADLLEDPQNT
jgi:DNA-binding CsgD family transcriptional regulator/tetratricopeptide (TPR) repeat protein